jgi:uncharacterized protein YqhQ
LDLLASKDVLIGLPAMLDNIVSKFKNLNKIFEDIMTEMIVRVFFFIIYGILQLIFETRMHLL